MDIFDEKTKDKGTKGVKTKPFLISVNDFLHLTSLSSGTLLAHVTGGLVWDGGGGGKCREVKTRIQQQRDFGYHL